MFKGTLASWVIFAKSCTAATAPQVSCTLSELEAKVGKLPKELAVQRMEKELLKKATA